MERQHRDRAPPGGRVWSLLCDERHARSLHMDIHPFITQVDRQDGDPVLQKLSLIF